MVLNATNSKMLAKMTGNAFLEDWVNIHIVVFVDSSVRFGKDTVEGLRITAQKQKPTLTPENAHNWNNAVEAVKRDGNADGVLKRVNMSEEHIKQLFNEAGIAQ